MRKNTANKVASTALSNFVRNTSPEEKEKIFKKILAVVCDAQNKTIAEAENSLTEIVNAIVPSHQT